MNVITSMVSAKEATDDRKMLAIGVTNTSESRDIRKELKGPVSWTLRMSKLTVMVCLAVSCLFLWGVSLLSQEMGIWVIPLVGTALYSFLDRSIES